MRKLNSHDLFAASRIIGALGYKKVIQNVYNEVNKKDDAGQTKSAEEVGVIVLGTLFDAISSDKKVERAFFEFASGPLEMSIEEIENLPPLELINGIKDLINLEDKASWKAFLNSLASIMR